MGRLANILYSRRSLSVPYSIMKHAEDKTTKHVDCHFIENCKICTHVHSIHKLEVSDSTEVVNSWVGYKLGDRKSCFDFRHNQ